MRIHRLYIGDFGIFRNQTLDELSPGLVVIGGLNRAGKTTFLQILRCLGYGIPRGQSLPPAAGRYEVECDVILDAGDRFCIRLMGHGDPQVSCVVGTSQINSCRELFNDLDHYTYCQLFTISLDELQRIQNTKDQDLKTAFNHARSRTCGYSRDSSDSGGVPETYKRSWRKSGEG